MKTLQETIREREENLLLEIKDLPADVRYMGLKNYKDSFLAGVEWERERIANTWFTSDAFTIGNGLIKKARYKIKLEALTNTDK